CIIDSLSQSFLVELLPYLMQLLFDSLKFLAINFSVACICSPCQLIDVVPNRSQLLCYLNRPRFINLGGLHAIPQCPLFRKSWHTHMKIVAVCSNSSYSWSLTRNLICRLSFLFSPINPTSYCSFF